jgi:hypothetical protein
MGQAHWPGHGGSSDAKTLLYLTMLDEIGLNITGI